MEDSAFCGREGTLINLDTQTWTLSQEMKDSYQGIPPPPELNSSAIGPRAKTVTAAVKVPEGDLVLVGNSTLLSPESDCECWNMWV